MGVGKGEVGLGYPWILKLNILLLPLLVIRQMLFP